MIIYYSNLSLRGGNLRSHAFIVIRNVLKSFRSAAGFHSLSRSLIARGPMANGLLLDRKLLAKNNLQFSKVLRRFNGNKGSDKPIPDQNLLYFVLLIGAGIIFLHFSKHSTLLIESVTFDYFARQMLSKGVVDKIFINEALGSALILIRPDAVSQQLHSKYFVYMEDISNFESNVRQKERELQIAPGEEVPITYVNAKLQKLIVLSGLMIWIFAALHLLFKNVKLNPFGNFVNVKITLVDPLTGQGKGVKFSDVAGMREAKQEVMEFVDYLKTPERYKNLGAKVPKGALLLGPPGCGKTMLAKAVATEANVPFLSVNGTEFIEIIGGLGAARVRNLFSEARKRSPCIIYIDEIDTIGRKRAEIWGGRGGNESESEQTLNQLLVEMDGMASRDGVIMLASTNRAEILDQALLRPGRFDRHIMIDLPTQEERKEIFTQHLKNIHLKNPPEYYVKRLASLTPGFSGADIANVCNEAALHAARYKKKVVMGDDLEYAVERMVGGTEKRSSSVSKAEKEMIAYHEAGRAIVGWLSEYGEILLKISVVPRTHQSIGWIQFSTHEQFLYSRNELFNKMCMALGGRVAELLIFNRISTKAEKDLKKVTRIAYAQVRQYGMNDVVGLVSFDEEIRGAKPYSKQLAALIDEEARKLVAKAYRNAEDIIRQNKKKLVALAEELIRRETLDYKDVEAIIGAPVKGSKKMVEPLEFDLAVDRVAGQEPASTPTNDVHTSQ